MTHELLLSSSSRVETIDISREVSEAVKKSGVADGVCWIFVPHTTAGVTINEGADPSVTRDLLAELNRIVPFEHDYHHSEGNSAAHIKSTLAGSSQAVLVENGNIRLGTWQAIYFCEFDGPRQRKVIVKVIPG